MATPSDRRSRSALAVGLVLLVVLALAVLGGVFRTPADGPTTPTPTQVPTPATTSAPGRTSSAPAQPSGKPDTAKPTAGRDDVDPVSGLPWTDPADLPPQARDTLALIDRGGPFPYPAKDGSTYRNLNRILPTHREGYYREYTVPTPGERDRGPRRIVVGQGGEHYWTADHYDSFTRIRR